MPGVVGRGGGGNAGRGAPGAPGRRAGAAGRAAVAAGVPGRAAAGLAAAGRRRHNPRLRDLRPLGWRERTRGLRHLARLLDAQAQRGRHEAAGHRRNSCSGLRRLKPPQAPLRPARRPRRRAQAAALRPAAASMTTGGASSASGTCTGSGTCRGSGLVSGICATGAGGSSTGAGGAGMAVAPRRRRRRVRHAAPAPHPAAASPRQACASSPGAAARARARQASAARPSWPAWLSCRPWRARRLGEHVAAWQGNVALPRETLDERACHDLFERARRALQLDPVIALQQREHFLARGSEQLRDLVNPDRCQIDSFALKRVPAAHARAVGCQT